MSWLFCAITVYFVSHCNVTSWRVHASVVQLLMLELHWFDLLRICCGLANRSSGVWAWVNVRSVSLIARLQSIDAANYHETGDL